MKILYIITQGELGGAQKYIAELSKVLKNKNWDINVAIGEDENNWLSQEINSLGGRIWSLKHLKRNISPLNDLLAIFELFKLLHKINPDVIHLNSSKAGLVGSFASLLYRISGKKIKVIYTAHGWVFNEPMIFFKKIVFIWLEKISSLIKDKIICVSEFDRITAIKLGIDTKKLITIHNGISLSKEYFFSKSEARKKINLNEGDFIIGTIANFYKTKGLFFLIEAFKILSEKNINKKLKLVIIGDGDLRSKLEEQIIKNKLNNVFLIGRINYASKYLKAFDIFVLSSIKEGLPYSLIEAQLAGNPIVATNVGGIPEIIKDGTDGLLVNAGDSYALAQKIQILINDNDKDTREKLGQSAIKKATEKFSIDRMVNATIKLYL